MIGLAVVGIGGYGFSLAQQIVQAGPEAQCRLVAAADNRLDQLSEQAAFLKSHGVEPFADFTEMLARLQGRCQGIYIATGIASHTPMTIAAARAGYHIHLEKPPAATVQEIDEMLAALAQTGRACLVGVQALHGLDLRLLKRRIVEGRLGDIRSVTCRALWPRDAGYYGRNAWAGKFRAGGRWVLDGPATNACFHQVVNSLHLAARHEGLATPVAVRGELYAAGSVESHNLAAFQVRTEEGPLVQLTLAHCTEGSVDPEIEVVGTGGTIHWPVFATGTIRYADGRIETVEHDKLMGRRMVTHFVQAVRAGDGSSLRCPLGEARKAVLALDGAHESSRRVHRIADRHVRVLDEGTPQARVAVEGLEETLARCFAARQLPSDLPDAPPWAVAGDWFDTRGYARFPAVFSA